ncbi:MAG: hypothetical protein IPJ27_19270 [Candidatus Accumulibacter sp.]|uniref:Uncharacterized protein n=1 Tax=Candidatus Accumulibacter proximus TaxID=2954385 RepID=A0A935Q295_9PROT|nr:hypothetical protein [Candidatus Accumulibacter proximus]
MSEHQTRLATGEIQFHQWCEPPLEAGEYHVEVTQTVQELADDPTSKGSYRSKFSFSVAGPRFALNPAEVYSVYPPKGQIGDFANSLPHVVFTRRTLPWERSLTPPRNKGDTRPWMALLVVSAADFPSKNFPECKTRKLGELINPAANEARVGPHLELDPYESEDDLCNTIDLPWEVFQSVAPSLDDLAYLAHVREVNTGAKETLSFLADGWFSVVLANRFPLPDKRPVKALENRAYLVSLEGLQDCLPGPKNLAANKPVRLAVLSSWTFHCCEAFAFKASMNQLKVRLLRVPRQADGAAGATLTPAEKQVRRAWDLGYTALNHSTRLGEKAVSWYRGPLVPLHLSKESRYCFLPAADAALRYSPLDGMMDVTYAAAFQLGRLLALQDRHFATALYAHRNRVRRQINDVLGRNRVGEFLGKPDNAGNAESDIMTSWVKTMIGSQTRQSGKDTWADLPPSSDAFQRETKGEKTKQAGELKLTTDFDLTIPQTVCQWLARLVLLYRVPFTYLVADERMLPPDSMRFFFLDPGWLKCLLEGACSVGRSVAHDELVDEYLRDMFLDFAMGQSLEVRMKPQLITSTSATNPSVVTTPVPHALENNDRILISGVSGSNAEINGEHPVTCLGPTTFSVPVDASGGAGQGGSFVRSRPSDIAVKQPAGRRPDWPLTGFLLRSPAVEGWQGLEMRAWKDSAGTIAIDPLRIDRLAPDIMLCIFNGKVDRIEVRQPPEGMHFGASFDGTGFQKLRLRRLNDRTEHDEGDGVAPGPGHQLTDSSQVPIPLRTNAPRVVEVAQLAKALKDKLEKLKGRDATQEFTSADFGVEMVESPGRVVFDVANQQDTDAR